MPLKEMLRAQLHSVRSDLVETYPHLNDDLLPWAPAEGMRTVQGQFVELISTERPSGEKAKPPASATRKLVVSKNCAAVYFGTASAAADPAGASAPASIRAVDNRTVARIGGLPGAKTPAEPTPVRAR